MDQEFPGQDGVNAFLFSLNTFAEYPFLSILKLLLIDHWVFNILTLAGTVEGRFPYALTRHLLINSYSFPEIIWKKSIVLGFRSMPSFIYIYMYLLKYVLQNRKGLKRGQKLLEGNSSFFEKAIRDSKRFNLVLSLSIFCRISIFFFKLNQWELDLLQRRKLLPFSTAIKQERFVHSVFLCN